MTSTDAAAASTSPSVSIGAKSSLPAVTGDVYVLFHLSKYASATVTTRVTNAPAGSKLELMALSFPFKAKAAVVGVTDVSETKTSSFKVTPAFATRYRAVLLGPSKAPIARSPRVTVYVGAGDTLSGKVTNCNTKPGNRPVCHQRFEVKQFTPASAAKVEIAKHRYTYLGLALGSSKEPPPPKTLRLNTHFELGTPAKVRAGEYEYSVAFSLDIGTHSYYFEWTLCTQDTESTDGIGLPGRHGCGAASVAASTSYLG